MRPRMILAGLALTLAGSLATPARAQDDYRHGRLRFVEPGVSLAEGERRRRRGGRRERALPARRPRVDERLRPRRVPVPRRIPGASRPAQQARLRRPRRAGRRAHRAAALVRQPLPARARARGALRGRDAGRHRARSRALARARRRGRRRGPRQRLRGRRPLRRRPDVACASRPASARTPAGESAPRSRAPFDLDEQDAFERWNDRARRAGPLGRPLGGVPAGRARCLRGRARRATATGATRRPWATSGCLGSRSTGIPTGTAAGAGRRTAGPGCPTSAGAGRRRTTGAGATAVTAGTGFPAGRGAPRG